MTDLIVAVGLLFVIEGLLWAAFPKAMLNATEEMGKLNPEIRRIMALAVALVGLLIIWAFH